MNSSPSIWRKSSATLLLLSYLFGPLPDCAAGTAKGRFAGEEIILEGLSLSYQLRFKDALAVFKKLELKHPGSPASSFYPAAITWGYVESEHRWRRVAELHAKTKVTKKVSTGTAKKLLVDMNKTIEICDKLLKKNGDDFEALFYLAGAHGFAFRMEYYNGNYLSAMLHGRRCAKSFEILFEKYPDKGDALLGPGVYKYFVGRLTPSIRYIVSMLGLSGSKEEGLALIEKAYHGSTISKMESADFLAMIYGRFERDFPKGLHWADVIEREGKTSPLASYHRLRISHLSGDRVGEERAAIELREKMMPVTKGLQNDWVNLLDYTLGAIKEENGDTDGARGYFIKAYSLPNLDPWLKKELRQRLGIN